MHIYMYKYSRVQENPIYNTDIFTCQSKEEFSLWFTNVPSSASFVMKIIHRAVLQEKKQI